MKTKKQIRNIRIRQSRMSSCLFSQWQDDQNNDWVGVDDSTSTDSIGGLYNLSLVGISVCEDSRGNLSAR